VTSKNYRAKRAPTVNAGGTRAGPLFQIAFVGVDISGFAANMNSNAPAALSREALKAKAQEDAAAVLALEKKLEEMEAKLAEARAKQAAFATK
jgi:hypothetical protein